VDLHHSRCDTRFCRNTVHVKPGAGHDGKCGARALAAAVTTSRIEVVTAAAKMASDVTEQGNDVDEKKKKLRLLHNLAISHWCS